MSRGERADVDKEHTPCIPLHPEQGSLSQAHAREVLNIVEEIRSLELVPRRGRTRLLERACGLVNADRLALVLLCNVYPAASPKPVLVERWSPAHGRARHRVVRRLGDDATAVPPEDVSPALPSVVCPETPVVSWRDPVVQGEELEPNGWRVSSLHRLNGDSDGHAACLIGLRGPERDPFDVTDAAALQLIQEQCGRLWQATLRGDSPETDADLPARLRPALRAILAGDTEPQAAERLGVSRHTIHDYVKKLYRHFGVRSRAELLTRCFAEGWHERLGLSRES